MSEKTIQINEKTKQKYEKRLNELKGIILPEVMEELREARAQGDLSENADYDAAREKLARVYEEIDRKQYILDNCVVNSEDKKHDVIDSGATFTIQYLEDMPGEGVKKGDEETFEIVGDVGAEFEDEKIRAITNNCPLVKSLEGKKLGDIATVTVPLSSGIKKYTVKITAVE